MTDAELIQLRVFCLVMASRRSEDTNDIVPYAQDFERYVITGMGLTDREPSIDDRAANEMPA